MKAQVQKIFKRHSQLITLLYFCLLTINMQKNESLITNAGTVCDSDCVVTCFKDEKKWQQKCLLQCGCENEISYSPEYIQEIQLQIDTEPQQCTDQCLLLCLNNHQEIKFTNNNKMTFLQAQKICRELCQCYSIVEGDQIIVQGRQQLNNFTTEQKQEQNQQSSDDGQDGSDYGMTIVATFVWITMIFAAIYCWCKYYSGCQSHSSQQNQDIYLQLKDDSDGETTAISAESTRSNSLSSLSLGPMRQTSFSLPHSCGQNAYYMQLSKVA